MNLRTLELEALRLPTADRAALAQSLLASLDPVDDVDVAARWLDEAEHRSTEIDTGIVETIPAEIVSKRARALLR
ncbi:MAG: addiction module antitoxin RelB [Xanthomonadaceae bacterium]|nr:addiction module antitoxin RelB [Xanthomonadaceae bacterium]